MADASPKICPQCGEEVPPDAPGGLCPRCVMAMNLAGETELTGESASSPIGIAEVARRLPQFDFQEFLGRGGMGAVYKARQKALDREVAVKVLAGEWQGREDFAERFHREAKTLAQMSHPNIVTVHDFGEADGLYYIVMEHVDGVNLRDLLSDGKLAAEQALAIVAPICEALEYAHAKGVVHRDIKPENLLLDRDGRVKIADFGIASLIGTTTEVSGTPSYMAPEQRSGVVDRRADIYALGVVLYEMLTGERPAKELVPPSRKVEVDVKIDEIVLRALEKEPEHRFATAKEFRTTVEAAVASPEGQHADHSAPPLQHHGLIATTSAITFFYAGVLVCLLATNLLPLGRSEDAALLLGLGVVLISAPFVGVAASNSLQRANAVGDVAQRDRSAGWLRGTAVVAGLLALPSIGFAAFFVQAMFAERGGWHPALSEAVFVPLTWLGAVLLPPSAFCLWRQAAEAGNLRETSTASASPWPKRVFWLVAAVVLTTPLALAAMVLAAQSARLGASREEAAAWLTAAVCLLVVALAPPVMALASLRRHPVDASNPWPRRVVLLICAIPGGLAAAFGLLLLPAWLAYRSASMEQGESRGRAQSGRGSGTHLDGPCPCRRRRPAPDRCDT